MKITKVEANGKMIAVDRHAKYPLVEVPAGEIQLRDDRKKKIWTVAVNAFLLAPVPVANELYGSYRVFRGGSWAEEARGCGATCRRRSHPTFRIDDLGFRLARSRHEGVKKQESKHSAGENARLCCPRA